MTTPAMRLPKFAEYGPQGSSGGLTRLRFRSDPLRTEQRWFAELRVNLDAPRPTPLLDTLRVRFEIKNFLTALGKGWRLLPHSHGALLCGIREQGLQLYHLEVINIGALYFCIALQPILRVAVGYQSQPLQVDNVSSHLASALPVTDCQQRSAWRLHNPTIFGSFIDVGWNLPIPHAPGAFQLKEHDGDLTLFWSASSVPSEFRVPAHALDPELEQALQDYEELRAPATAALLSAASIGDASGAWLAMQIAAIAARHEDTNTLRVLRVAHQRAMQRGRQEIGTIVCLITCNAALGDTDKALQLVPLMESRIGADLKLPDTAGWVGAHLRNLLVVPSHTPRDFRAVVTPSAGSEIVLDRNEDGSHTPLPATLQTQHDSSDLSAVERARLDIRSRSIEESANVPSARRELSFSLARQAFAGDDDLSAWRLVQQAVEHGELVDNDETGTMILRLIAKFSDDIAEATVALRSIHFDRVNPELFARASQQLAEKLLALGRTQECLTTLAHALTRVPDSILLRVAYAEALGMANDPAAIDVWKSVLAHPSLEPWELHRYRKELASLLKQTDQHGRLLEELRELHIQDPSNIPLTNQLASLLEEREAIDEAVIVRSRHAASVASLRGYPSVALLVQAINSKGILSLQGALAAAQAVHLAASIAHPSAWLHRALVTLAERFDDPLILEYALHAARALDDQEKVRTLELALNALVESVNDAASVPTSSATHLTASASAAPRHDETRRPSQPFRRNDADEDQDDDEDDLIPTRAAEERQIDTELLTTLLEHLEALYPRRLTGQNESDSELETLSRALSKSLPSAERAELLGRRAVIMLRDGHASGAAQAWTGAMILMPDDLRALAGLTVARTLSQATRAAASSREHLLEEVERLHTQNPHALPEALLRIAALLS